MVREIPVIDYGPWFAGDDRALGRLACELAHACEEVGFYYALNHGVPGELIERAFNAARCFFAMPLDRKMALQLNQDNVGYLPIGASVQAASTVHKAARPTQNQSFFVSHDRGFDHPDVIAGKPLRGRNQWPADLPELCADMMAYFAALSAMCERMLPSFAAAIGMTADFFTPYFAGEPHTSLRFLRYPPQNTIRNGVFGQAPHTDNCFITVLAPSNAPGLAMRLPTGSWFEPPTIPGAFLINLGNILRRWSNDRFLSTPHRVINASGLDRYSIAFFFSPAPDSQIECLPSCASADNPARYQPAVYRDLILEFYRPRSFCQKDQ